MDDGRVKRREGRMKGKTNGMKVKVMRSLMIVCHSSLNCYIFKSCDFECIAGILSIHTVRSKCIANSFFHVW
jgi:hypothetical protein